jgi:hypothetical protein
MQHEEPAAPVKQGEFAAMGCIDASVFGDTGDGC